MRRKGRMVALRRMARSQEKINESQELTTQDDIVLSISPRRDDEERRGWKRRKNGNPDSWEWKGGDWGIRVAKGNFKLRYLCRGWNTQRDHTCKLPRYRSPCSKSPSRSISLTMVLISFDSSCLIQNMIFDQVYFQGNKRIARWTKNWKKL